MNEADNAGARCSRCGAVVPAAALEGLCPRCLMALNLSADSEAPEGEGAGAGTKTARPTPPKPEEIAKFFPQLAHQRDFGRLAGGDLAARKFPQTGQRFAFRALGKQDPAVGVDEHYRRDEDDADLRSGSWH